MGKNKMAFLKMNKAQVEAKDQERKEMFGTIEPGEYEMYVEKAEFRNKKGTTPNINVTLVIRSDVEQAHKGRKIFHTFWISNKSPEGHEFCMNMILSFLNKIGAEDGQDFISEKEVAAFMVANPIVGIVGTDTYNGKERSVIEEFEVSEFFGEKVEIVENDKKDLEKAKKQVGEAGKTKRTGTTKKAETKTAVDEDPFANEGETIEIDDDDLPF